MTEKENPIFLKTEKKVQIHYFLLKKKRPKCLTNYQNSFRLIFHLPSSSATLTASYQRKLNIHDTSQATQCSNKVLCQVHPCMLTGESVAARERVRQREGERET